jgi:small-conductance mechanosensitive channel
MHIYERLGLNPDFFRGTLFSIGETAITLEKVIVITIILLVTVLVSRLLQRATRKALAMRGVTDEGSVGVARRLLHYVLMVIGIGIAVETVGISLSALFAAGAVFAIGVGFAMQNIVQNFVSGLILLTERTIKPGDVLEVGGTVVKVRHMGIRATICRTLDEEELIVPNSSIVQGTVTNYTLQDSLYRLRAQVGVIYGSDMALVRRTLEETAAGLDWRLPDLAPVVLMTEFADSAVVWDVSVWIDDPWIIRRARSNLNEAIWWALKEKGIVIAFPQLDVHLDPDVVAALRGREAEGRG